MELLSFGALLELISVLYYLSWFAIVSNVLELGEAFDRCSIAL